MAYKLQLKRGLLSALPIGISGEPLFTTDTNDLYISNGTTNQKFQKFIASGTSSQFLKGDGSLDSNTYYLSSNPSAYIALTALTTSAPLSYNNTTGAFTISQASGSTNGYLSSTDWTTFNNKQSAITLTTTGTSGAATLVGSTLNIPQYQSVLTNPVTGTGTTTRLPIWTSSTALGNSGILDNGTSVTLDSRALIGTSATFTGNMNADDYNMAAWKILDWNGVVAQIGGISASQWTQLEFFTSGTSKMTLTSGGNLLVGTSVDSGEKLQVSGSAKVSGKLIVNHSSTDYIAEFINTSSANPYGVIIKDAASAANNYPLFHIVNNAASVEYFRVNSGTGNATFSSSVTATSFIKSGGTSSQYLMADGSVTTGGGGGSVDELQVALLSQVYG